MEARCKISLDLVQRGADPVIQVVQGDTGTRVMDVSFYAAGVAWEIPAGVSLAMRFRKPDGTQGLYTKLPDGTDAATISTTDRSKATFKLAPQTMTVAGDVKADLAVTSVDQVIASFPIILRVHENPAGDQTESEDYYAFPTLGDINAELDKLDKLSQKAVYTVNGALPDETGNVNTPGAGTGGDVVSVNGKNGIVVLKLEDLQDFKQSLLDCVRPVGSYYWSDVDTDPGALFGGTWEQVKDRFILAAGDTYAAGATGGEATHTLTAEEMPKHTHVQQGVSNDGFQVPMVDMKKSGAYTGSSFSMAQSDWSGGKDAVLTRQTGGDKSHNNMPPYRAAYVWRRTA